MRSIGREKPHQLGRVEPNEKRFLSRHADKGRPVRCAEIGCIADPLCFLICFETGPIIAPHDVGRGIAWVAIVLMAKEPDRSAIERSEEHTSELQSLMRNSYAVFCLKKKNILS